MNKKLNLFFLSKKIINLAFGIFAIFLLANINNNKVRLYTERVLPTSYLAEISKLAENTWLNMLQAVNSNDILSANRAERNLIIIIMANVTLAKAHTNNEDRNFSRLIEIEKGVMQAKKLSQQLLTFKIDYARDEDEAISIYKKGMGGKKAVIVQIVEGKKAVLLVGKKEEAYLVDMGQLPAGAKEGDWIKGEIVRGKLIVFQLDHEETAYRKQMIEDKIKKLKGEK